MIKVETSKDKVLIDLCTPRRDILLSCSQAYALADALIEAAKLASLQPPEVVRGISWQMDVESFDGKVAIRFKPPEGNTATVVPLPHRLAEKVADLIRFKAQQAEHKMRLTLSLKDI